MADTKISALPAATTIGSSDVVPIVQGGATKKLAPSAVGGALFNLATPGSDGSIVYANADGTTHTELASALIINQIKDSTDPTKVAQFDASGITTGTTRTTTIPNANNVLVVPDTGASNNFLTAISAAGAISKAQPAIANVSDATTVGQNLVKATNPSAITFPKVAADNTVSFRTPAQVLSDIGAQASGSYAGLTSNTFTNTQTVAAGTIAANTPALTITQTWNNAAVSFVPITVAITDTASTGSGSGLINFTVGGTSQFGVNKSGIVNANTSFTVGSTLGSANTMTMNTDRIYNASSGGDLSIGSSGLNNQIKIANKVVSYNSITTAGNGVPAIVGAGRATAQSAANSNIVTYTLPASDGSYEISMNMNVTAVTALSTSLNCDYTDESNTARTMILPLTGLTGSFLAGGLATATGAFETPVMHIRCKASTTIKLYTAAGTFTGVTYTAEGIIKQTQ